MAFPSISGTRGFNHPRTGLHPATQYESNITPVHSMKSSERYGYVLWELSVKYGKVDGFFDNNTKELWVWAECSNRWWKANVDDARITGKSDIDSVNFVKTQSFAPNDQNMIVEGGSRPSTGSNTSSSQTGIQRGVMWSTWIGTEWVVKHDFCDYSQTPTESPVDDCIKYGVNCPEPLPSGKIFTRIDSMDRLPRRGEILTYGLWSNNVGNLTTFYTCSMEFSDMQYRQVVYNRPCNDCGSEPQFDIAYGHYLGSGSKDLGGYDDYTPTNAIYSQYRLLCLAPDQERFTYGSTTMDDIYVVNVRRDRMVQRLDEGNIEINLAHLSGSEYIAGGGDVNEYTGSMVTLAGTGKVLRLIDDSRIDFDELDSSALSGSYDEQSVIRAHRVKHGGRVYYMVSGSLETGIYNVNNPHVYGLLYPHLGLIVLDAAKLDSSASYGTVRGTEVFGDNPNRMLLSISGAAQYTDESGDILGFQSRRKEKHWVENYFIRVKNADYNFTNNPTFVAADGLIRDSFQEQPRVYISTVGLYNERRELVAVGKVSRPIQKTCTSEALFKVRLKY